MVRTVKVATQAIQFDTTINHHDRRIITVVDGEIVRIIEKSSVRGCCLYVKENSNLEFDDCFDKKEKDSRHPCISITYKEKGSVYHGAKLDEISKSEFESLCCKEIRLLSEYNLKELKNLFLSLNDGVMKDKCRKCQKEMLELLNF